MGYTKIVQFGNITEHYSYENNLSNNKRKRVTELTKKRQKQARIYFKSKGTYQRSRSSIRRSQNAFYRLCHHNTTISSTIHFLTLTLAYDSSYKTAIRYVSDFFSKIKRNYPEIPLSYISVPELTKKNRYHFHLLLFNLPSEESKFERTTRNFQRLFERGYIDIRYADYNSEGVAGYMAKYMGKFLGDSKSQAERGYNCSRNIQKIRSASGNTIDQYEDLIIPTSKDIQIKQYDVPFLGNCIYKKIVN